MRVCARVCVSEKEMSSIFTQSLHGMCRFDDHPPGHERWEDGCGYPQTSSGRVQECDWMDDYSLGRDPTLSSRHRTR